MPALRRHLHNLRQNTLHIHGTLIFFVHPKDMQGVLTEIMEVPTQGGH